MTVKTKLNKSHREAILLWMRKEKIDTSPKKEETIAAMNNAITLINIAIRNKYPENEMVILRKYECVRRDYCVLLTLDGQVFALEIPGYFEMESTGLKELAEKIIADMPRTGGCYNNVIFEGTKEIREAIDAFSGKVDSWKTFVKTKLNEYESFLAVCKYFEDVEAIVPLPDSLRKQLTGKSSALVNVNPDVIKNIKNDFQPTKKRSK